MPLHRSQSISIPPRARPTRPPLVRNHSAKSLLRNRTIPDVPVPPSLADSPLLNSPRSVFRRTHSTLRLPTKRDEEWLGDTVPVHTAPPARTPLPRWWTDAQLPAPAPATPTRPHQRPRAATHSAPLSPPLTHWRMSAVQSPGRDTAPPPHDRQKAVRVLA
ncbi:hypothetical protein FA95DRAFT_1565296 [Auriscalpium vulgare]|uniref:Uncharacterized protein n=1 Tax=Auriscalpium vulgare TaxID=40419 RepID=A0ACB8RBU9_9AGAM|nr:hypothetical protein FA95DRAFT_1565296 [Auriscalpium vulgare]